MSGIAPADEAGLLQRICVDDEVAFEYTYLEVYGPLREFAYALTRDDAVAHDIVQDVLFTFWRDRARLDIRDRFVPYLYKAVRNQCAKRWRHHRVVRAFQTTSESEDAAPGMSAAPPSVDDAIERTELHTALMAAVEQLSERQRAVVTLYLTGTMSATEIGDVLGLAPSAVLMNLSRARTTLRAVLMQFVR
jgi:RNA polymerase sigma-70 factor (ECF subfamily)